MLYGLKSSVAVFRKHLAETLEDQRFYSSYADPDLWMRTVIKPDGEEYYEYILSYVDDILCMLMNARDVMEQIGYKFKLKKDKIQPPDNYPGAGIKKRQLGNAEMWTMSQEYVEAGVKNVKETLKKQSKWTMPKRAATPMMYEPELDGSEELNSKNHTYYQEFI